MPIINNKKKPLHRKIARQLLKEHWIGRNYHYYIISPIKKMKIQREITREKIIDDKITIIIISAGRKDYLKKTIESLKKNIIYDKDKILWHIIDDYPEGKDTRDYINSLDFDVTIFNEKNIGFGNSINKIFSTVYTKYVFHCEDDWQYLRPIPVREMINLLEDNPELGQIKLNREDGYGKHEVIYKKNYVDYPDYFSTNPNITKLKVFRENYPYAKIFTETLWTKRVRKAGYRTGIFGFREKIPYVRHIGEERKVRIKI